MGRQSLPITFKLRQRINIGRISPFIPIQQTPLTFKPFLDKYKKRYGKQSKSVTADSRVWLGGELQYLEMEEMMGYVKYNWFHKEQHKPFKEDAFNQANFYYNRDDDYYVCPMGQHMEPCGQRQTKSDSGYVSVITLYRAQRCDGCPLGSLCKKSKGNRTIYVNHKLNAYKKEAFLLLTSEEGLKHRSQRPIEPEAVFVSPGSGPFIMVRSSFIMPAERDLR